jgi:DNA-binding SARP family transcriptional activator
MLRISLLGVLRLEVDGVEVVAPSSRRARLLLAMLAVERRQHSRDALAGRLWPGVLDESARASLRTALTQLRAALGPDAGRFLEAARGRVALAGAEVWTDVGELDRLLEAGEVQAALELWGGELLTGLEEEWVYERRDELRQRLCDAIGPAADEAEAGGDLETALGLTRRQVALDPLAEEPQHELIRRLARTGNRAAALSVYDKLAQRLREQLGTVPSAATRELAEAVRTGAGVAGGKRWRSATGQGDVAAVPVAPLGEAAGGREGIWRVLPRSLQPSAASAFVGREVELACLRERWTQVSGGARSAAVVIGGEPGIGKTRLAAEFARVVHGEGALVLYGRCDEGLAVPYQPFVEALRPYARAAGPDRLRAELGHLAPELARLLPELAGLGEPVRADPESERFALFEAVTALIEAMTYQRRVLVVLDDLHWATTPTLLMLRHLLRSERLLGALVLCAYRDTEVDLGQPLAQLLADLHRDASAERLSIGGLDEPAIAALLEAAVGHALDEPASQLVQVLGAQTAGNPFFIRELLAHLAESGTLAPGGERSGPGVTAAQLEVPAGLRHVIGQRVARLSGPAARALRVAAVAGPKFSFVLLERVLGDGFGVLDAVDEAVAAGLLTEAGHGEHAFAHALVRQTIYEQLGSARRTRLHRQLGEALEALGDADEHVGALAYHFAQAAADGQGVKAADYALAAGRSAGVRLGYEEAAAHYERGLEAITVNGQPQWQRRCELLLALGEARWGEGELDKARQACGQAAELAEKLGDATALAHAALGFCGPYRVELGAAMTRTVVDLLERALTALGENDSALRAQLMGRLAIYIGVEHRKPVLARQALEMARRVADKATLAEVLASTLWAIHGPDALHESMATAEELGRVADEVGDRRLRALAHRWQLDHLLELGDIEAVERELDALQRLADARRERYFTWLLGVFRASHAHLEGRLEDCERLALEAVSHGFAGHDEPAIHIFGAQMIFIRREQGRLDELVETIESFAGQYPQVASWRWRCGLASIYAQLGRRTEARQELEALARDVCDAPRDALWLTNLSGLCDVVVFLGDVPRAQLLYELLSPYADRCAVAFVLLSNGSVSRLLGLLATTLSRYEDAARHFEHALTMNAQIRSPLWIAHTQHDYARMLLARRQPGDHDKALELLNEALAAAEQLGLKALVDEAQPLKLAAEAAGPLPALPRRG